MFNDTRLSNEAPLAAERAQASGAASGPPATDRQQQADAAYQQLLANFSGHKDTAQAEAMYYSNFHAARKSDKRSVARCFRYLGRITMHLV
jgi:hypothetical protein